MDTKDYKAKEYHCMVWDTAKRETELYFRSDWRNWIGNIVTGIASGLITSYIFGVWGGDMTPLPVTLVGIAFGTFFGIVFFIVVLYGYNGLWTIPAKLYRKKETEADLYNFDHIVVKGDPISILDYWQYSIEIKNEKPYQINPFAFEITYLEIDGKVIYRRPTEYYKVFMERRLIAIDSRQLGTVPQKLEVNNSNSVIHYELLDRIGEKYRIQYAEPGELQMQVAFTPRDDEFSKSIRGELQLVGQIGQYMLSNGGVYFFQAKVVNESIDVRFGIGRLKYYLNG